MIGNLKNIFIAILSGFFLTLMFQANSALSENTTPVVASWVAHGIGMVVSLLLIILFVKKKPQTLNNQQQKIPKWLYFGGIPGAFTVILATMAMNGGIPLSSTISLGLVGQLLFGFFADHFGLFGSQKRRLTRRNFAILALIMSGCFLIIYSL
ncbi:DMT family transporter [Serratia sp. NPDC078593]|uniref:DMT family transporter n=1 Tax=unclassified Serratia (in: enterobacteria) TaxID=2647522 RepID=UPI0037D9287F